MANNGVHIVVGRGPLGKAVAKSLLAREKLVRVIGKSPYHTWNEKTVEELTYDVSQKDQAMAAFEGASVVYQCAGPPYNKWSERYPALIEGIIAGANYNNARLVVGDNLYMYGDVSGPLKESFPYQTTTTKGIVRANAARRFLEAHQQGEIEVAIGRGSDFFGPHVLHSIIGRVFPNIVKGKRATIVGDPDQLHTYTFIEDFGKALAILGENDQAFGQVWHVPNAGTITTKEFLAKAYGLAGYKPRIKTMSKGTLRVGGLFNADAREVIELLYQFEKPFIVDDSKFIDAFGDCSTDLEAALETTVSWFNSRLN